MGCKSKELSWTCRVGDMSDFNNLKKSLSAMTLVETKFLTITESWFWVTVILFWFWVVATVNLFLHSLSPSWYILKDNMFVDPLMVKELFFCISAVTKDCAVADWKMMKDNTRNLISLFITDKIRRFDKNWQDNFLPVLMKFC